MDTGASVRINYWIGREDFFEVSEFRNELADSYISVVHGRKGSLGLGLHELSVEFLSNLSLAEVAKFLLEGIAYDLIKSGTKAFVLRPFLIAYQKFKRSNQSIGIDIAELRLVFQDSVVVIYRISPDSILRQLESVLVRLSQRFRDIIQLTGEWPFEVHIPVFEDLREDRLCRFRTLLDVDETITNIKDADYLKFWGLCYGLGTCRAYDVERSILRNEEFYTQQRYWSETSERRRERTSAAVAFDSQNEKSDRWDDCDYAANRTHPKHQRIPISGQEHQGRELHEHGSLQRPRRR